MKGLFLHIDYKEEHANEVFGWPKMFGAIGPDNGRTISMVSLGWRNGLIYLVSWRQKYIISNLFYFYHATHNKKKYVASRLVSRAFDVLSLVGIFFIYFKPLGGGGKFV